MLVPCHHEQNVLQAGNPNVGDAPAHTTYHLYLRSDASLPALATRGSTMRMNSMPRPHRGRAMLHRFKKENNANHYQHRHFTDAFEAVRRARPELGRILNVSNLARVVAQMNPHSS